MKKVMLVTLTIFVLLLVACQQTVVEKVPPETKETTEQAEKQEEAPAEESQTEMEVAEEEVPAAEKEEEEFELQYCVNRLAEDLSAVDDAEDTLEDNEKDLKRYEEELAAARKEGDSEKVQSYTQKIEETKDAIEFDKKELAREKSEQTLSKSQCAKLHAGKDSAICADFLKDAQADVGEAKKELADREVDLKNAEALYEKEKGTTDPDRKRAVEREKAQAERKLNSAKVALERLTEMKTELEAYCAA